MPPVHPKHVVSFSSEDPHHPASNLLSRESFRKWKCKDPGEKEAYVILRFDKAVTINALNIGNDGSALVEVSVARSGSGGEPQFEVLLSSCAFMGPLESREGKNLCGVKNFSINGLSKPIAVQKWDLVKVQVSQPFNRHVQYGLSFIHFNVAPDPDEPQKIGVFGLRKPIGGGDSDSDEDLRPGSLFNRKFSPKGNPTTANSTTKPSTSVSTAVNSGVNTTPKTSTSLSTAAAIRETSAKLTNAAKSKTEDDVRDLLRSSRIDSPSTSFTNRNNSPVQKRKQDAPEKTSNSTPKQNTNVATSLKTANGSSSKKRALSPEPSSSSRSTSSPSTSRNAGTPAKKPKKIRKTKPFNKLMEGVSFVISGFENPLRGQIRDKAVGMGARYKADWDRSCTHLICAFYNTPKFRQVKGAGNGKIVKKDWIEKSWADKCRYPWRRHCLDRDDKKDPESEDEIFADDDDEFVDDTEPLITPEKETITKRRRALVLDSSEDDDNDEDAKSESSKKAYEADTDVDDDKTPDLSPSIMDSEKDGAPFFKRKHFFVDNDSSSSNSTNASGIKNIIRRHKGDIDNAPNDHTDFYICHTSEWSDDFTDALSDNPNLSFLHKDWIIECDKRDQMVEKSSFIISPH